MKLCLGETQALQPLRHSLVLSDEKKMNNYEHKTCRFVPQRWENKKHGQMGHWNGEQRTPVNQYWKTAGTGVLVLPDWPAFKKLWTFSQSSASVL